MNVNNVVDVMNNFKGEGVMPVGIDTVIKILRPGSKWQIEVKQGEYIYHKWWDPNGLKAPTKKEIDDELEYQIKLQKYYQYAYSRCSEYPDGFEQLDMLWHAINNGQNLKDSDWFQIIKEIKEKYPKPKELAPIRE